MAALRGKGLSFPKEPFLIDPPHSPAQDNKQELFLEMAVDRSHEDSRHRCRF